MIGPSPALVVSLLATAVAAPPAPPSAAAATSSVAAPGAALPAAPGQDPLDLAAPIERLFDQWRFREAEAALRALGRDHAVSPAVSYLQGYARFLAGDYPAAAALLAGATAAAPDSARAAGLAALNLAADAATRGHARRASEHFVVRYPPEDEVLADYALEALEAALLALRTHLGFVPDRPIPVDIYRSPADLAAVSTLTVEEVERTGTIALCKWARLMATSPRALRTGYPWLDSLAHELVHYAVSSLSHDRVPVWLQEGLAKFLERTWRGGPPALALQPSMQSLLARALATGKLISFDAMHPSMAKLPRAEDTALAFAEVATAVAALHEQHGTAALRQAIEYVRDGMDARDAVAAAASTSWPRFEKDWRAYIGSQRFRARPGVEPLVPRFRAPGAVAARRAPDEDEAAVNVEAAGRYLRLGNKLLARNHAAAAAIEYEKGLRASGGREWIFAVKLGRTYLALGRPKHAETAVAGARDTFPELPWPHLIAGQALLAQGAARPAVAALMESLATNPFDPRVHCALEESYRLLPDDPSITTAHRARAERFCRDLAR